MEKINDVTFRLEISQPMKVKKIHDAFHVSLLRPYFEDKFSRTQEPLPPTVIEDGTPEYEVEAILATKRIRGKTKFLVKWKGYGDHENSWQTQDDLKNAAEILKKFQDSEASRRRLSKRGGM